MDLTAEYELAATAQRSHPGQDSERELRRASIVAPDRTERDANRSIEGMSGLRWLLFIALSRLQTSEQTYLGLPNATTIARQVLVRAVNKP